MSKAGRDYAGNSRSKSKQSSSDKPVRVPFSELQFVNLELSSAEKTNFRELDDSGEFDDVDIESWILLGYKLSISYDFKNACCTASLTASYRNMVNSGLILSARAGSASAAIRVLAFKDKYLADDGLWQPAADRRRGTDSDIG